MKTQSTTIAISEVGYWSGVAACASTVGYGVVQILQIAGVLRFPFDEILIYGASLCIVVPFVLEMLALHYLTANDKQFWTHASLIFTIIYAVFVSANYVVQHHGALFMLLLAIMLRGRRNVSLAPAP